MEDFILFHEKKQSQRDRWASRGVPFTPLNVSGRMAAEIVAFNTYFVAFATSRRELKVCQLTRRRTRMQREALSTGAYECLKGVSSCMINQRAIPNRVDR